MICYIKGEILDLKLNKIEILTDGGLGYSIGISEINYAEIFDKKLEKIELYVFHNITDNSQALYGFLEKEEKYVFEELIKISGVGGKVALLILSLGINLLSESIINKDKKTIESVKGIGKKMAEKIILELKDKEFIKNYDFSSNEKNKENKKSSSLNKTVSDNVKDTLINMGYQSKDIIKVLENIPEELSDLNEILPWVIKELG